jgi:hypothetical protein
MASVSPNYYGAPYAPPPPPPYGAPPPPPYGAPPPQAPFYGAPQPPPYGAPPTPGGVVIVTMQPGEQRIVDYGDTSCAQIGCFFSWIPLVGFINWCANNGAPEGSTRRKL